LTSYIEYYTSPALNDRLGFFHARIIKRYEEIYGKDLVKRILLPLHLRRRKGMREDEILSIAKISKYEWTEFYNSLQNYIDKVGNRFILLIPFKYVSNLVKHKDDIDVWQAMEISEILSGMTPCISDLAWDGGTTDNHVFYISQRPITERQYNAVMGIDQMGTDKEKTHLTKSDVWHFIRKLKKMVQTNSRLRLPTANEYFSAGMRGLLEEDRHIENAEHVGGAILKEVWYSDEEDMDADDYLFLACDSL